MKDLTPDERWEQYKHTMTEEHLKPSPETRERLKALEVNNKNIMDEIREIKDLIKELKFDLKQALNTKANKWTEKVLLWAGLAIGGAIISFLTWFIASGIALRFI